MKIALKTRSFVLPPQGAHPATCVGIIDYGTQKSSYRGSETSRRMLVMRWEIGDEYMEDGRPFTVQQPYTLSLNEKATLRKHLEGWRGKPITPRDYEPDGFDLKALLGNSCLLNVVHTRGADGSERANVSGIMPLPKGTSAPRQPQNAFLYVSLTADEFDEAAFLTLPMGTQEKIKASPEYQALVAGPMPSNLVAFSKSTTKEPWDSDDDVPFE